MRTPRYDTAGEEGAPLVGGGCEGCADEYFMEYDEDGTLALARALGGGAPPRHEAADDFAAGARRGRAADLAKKPCKVGALNGSWYLQLTPKGPHTLTEIRGPMRIEVAPPKLRVSGDIYINTPLAGTGPFEVLRPITAKPLLFRKNWYPQLPMKQYSWYFRSVGVTYDSGRLVFKFERHLWNRTTQEFITQENAGKSTGFMQLECLESAVFTHPLLPQPTLRLTGTAQVGGETYDVVATKTSPFYRGCAVEVDVMTTRSFPLSATTAGGAAVSFASIYRTAGFDCAVTVDQTNLPDDAQLSTIEMQTALASNRRPAVSADAWRLWLLVGSAQGGLFGLMFDDVEPFREGTAGFFDPRLPSLPTVAASARNKKLGEVPDAFLRTLVHEAGHAFNLFHPKHDVHNVPVGTTIMNQTGDVMGFATEADPYPGNITFGFDDHNRTSLIHSPDPQVAPGWKRFGWGHGDLSSGVPEPVDAAGFLRHQDEAGDLTLELAVPENLFRGQFVAAQFTVTNRGGSARTLTSAINLSQGDLRLLLKAPGEELSDVRDCILGCGDRPLVTLGPGESITGSGQIFYTNVGFTFRQTGRYFVSAELDVGDGSGEVLRSNLATVVVRAPVTPEEEEIARLSMDTKVGRAFAFGDFSWDRDEPRDRMPEAERRLRELADNFGHTGTGVAAALTLANAHSRDLRDLYTGAVLRKADAAGARARFRSAAARATLDSPHSLVMTAAAVAAPTEAAAPVLDLAAEYLQQAAPARSAVKGGKGAKKRGGTKKGRKASSATAADDAPSVAPAAAADALDLLTDVRRTFASGG
jgi:hypothetical protein